MKTTACLYDSTLLMVLPISAAEGAIVAPAAFRASTLAEAVAAAPVIMAPACPIRFPAGAVEPAIIATIGFLNSDLM